MATNAQITRDGNTINCVYPRSSFATIFEVSSDLYKWVERNAKFGLAVHDQQALALDIDSAINNIENLDLA